MKKNYIGIVALAICSTGFAQSGVNTQRLMQKTDYSSGIEATTPLTEKGITLWSNNCSNAADWVFTNTSVPTTNEWYHETANLAMPSSNFGDFAATTAANGFLIVNSDGAPGNSDGDGTPIIADVTIAAPIDLSATGSTGQAEMNVVLTFEHNFRWWQDIRQVNVSGDNGASWTTFDVSDASGNVIGAQAQNSGNPEVTTFNISAVAGGSSQVLIQFHYDDQDNWAWYWAIDDIKITRQDADDLVSIGSYFGSNGLPYFSIPTTQIAPVDFYAIANNTGSNDQTASIVTVDVNTGTYAGTSAGMTIVSGTADTLVATTAYTPASAAGSHAISYVISSAATDATPTNNVALDTFDIVASTGTYGRDRGVVDGQGGGEDNATPGDFAFEAGSAMEIFADQQVYGIDIVIGTNTPAGTVIYGKLYSDDGAGGFLYIDETAEYTTTQADADNNVTKTLALFTYPTLTAATVYYPMVACYSEFYYATSGESEPQTSYVLYPTAGGTGSQYYTTSSPMVRFNFDPAIMGIEGNVENTMELGQNMPNPFNNTTAINYSVKSNANVTLDIVDMTGKVVMSLNEGTKAAGEYTITLDGSELAEGMYYYTLSNGETSITKNMTIIK